MDVSIYDFMNLALIILLCIYIKLLNNKINKLEEQFSGDKK